MALQKNRPHVVGIISALMPRVEAAVHAQFGEGTVEIVPPAFDLGDEMFPACWHVRKSGKRVSGLLKFIEEEEVNVLFESYEWEQGLPKIFNTIDTPDRMQVRVLENQEAYHLLVRFSVTTEDQETAVTFQERSDLRMLQRFCDDLAGISPELLAGNGNLDPQYPIPYEAWIRTGWGLLIAEMREGKSLKRRDMIGVESLILQETFIVSKI